MSMTPIATQTLSTNATSVVINVPSNDYKSLFLSTTLQGYKPSGGQAGTVYMRFNSVTTNSYEFQDVSWRSNGSYGGGNTLSTSWGMIYPTVSSTGDAQKVGIRYWLPAYSYTLNAHTGLASNGSYINYAIADEDRGMWSIVKNDSVTAAISTITLTTDVSGFGIGSVFNLYGIG